MIKVIIMTIFLCSQFLLVSFTANAANDPGNKAPAFRQATPGPLLRVSGVRKWYLIGNALTPGNDEVQLRVVTDSRIRSVEAFIDNQPKGLLSQTPVGFDGAINISDLAPGKHSLQLFAEGSSKLSLKKFFYRSHPYYALLTTDWDSSDSRDSVLKLHEKLHAEHPALKITHFLGPYTFTDPKVSTVRQAYLANWMIRLRTSFQDEIGLHIHPFCNFVNIVSGVYCRFKPSDTYKRGDSSGYTVLSSAYSETEFLRLLKAADALFIAHGLGKPTSFRTGSWAANAQTLKALAAGGFVADSSANNWVRIKEESENDGNGVLYKWNHQHWTAINDRSQPYFPAELNPMTNGMPTISILEVPDNGSLVDYVTGDEMISIFKSNWNGQALSNPVTYVFGFHPVSYNKTFHKRIEKTLSYIDQFLAANDNGPVIYETLSNIARVFPQHSPLR